MGGAMAIHLGYKLNSNVAGVFALSSFLPQDSRLYEVQRRLEYKYVYNLISKFNDSLLLSVEKGNGASDRNELSSN